MHYPRVKEWGGVLQADWAENWWCCYTVICPMKLLLKLSRSVNESSFILIKETIHQEDKTTLNMCDQTHIRSTNFIKQILLVMKPAINEIVSNITTSLSLRGMSYIQTRKPVSIGDKCDHTPSRYSKCSWDIPPNL